MLRETWTSRNNSHHSHHSSNPKPQKKKSNVTVLLPNVSSLLLECSLHGCCERLFSSFLLSLDLLSCLLSSLSRGQCSCHDDGARGGADEGHPNGDALDQGTVHAYEIGLRKGGKKKSNGQGEKGLRETKKRAFHTVKEMKLLPGMMATSCSRH